MRGYLQRATSTISNERILHQVTSTFLQRTTFATGHKQIF